MLNAAFVDSILPHEEYAVSTRQRDDLPGNPIEITVEILGKPSSPDDPVCYVAHAYSPEEVEPAMQRAKQKLCGQAHPKTMLAPALARV